MRRDRLCRARSLTGTMASSSSTSKFGNNPGQNWGATGHADLWDGQTFYDELWGISNAGRDFFTIANGVSLWLMSGTGTVGE